MSLYIGIFLIAVVFFYTSRNNNKFLLFISFAGLALFVGFGDMIGGYDRYIYGAVFDAIADGVRAGRSYESLYMYVQGSEFGYFWWQVLVAHITQNRYIFILLSTILMYILYYKVFTMYLENYSLGVIVFLGLFFFFTMTYLRQVIAVGFVWLSFQYVWKRKFIPFLIFVALGASFHNSALIALPVYFIPIKKFSKGTITFGMIVAILIGLTPIASLVLSGVGEAGNMSSRTAAYATDQMGGFRVEYLLEAIFFLWIFFTNYAKIETDKMSLTFYNLSLYFCAILLMFIRFGQGGRFGWYFFIGIIYMLSNLSTKKNAKSWMAPLTILISFLLYMRIVLAWTELIYPYKSFLSNGIPSAVGTYEGNEYDFRYTDNKLYRPVFDPVF